MKTELSVLVTRIISSFNSTHLPMSSNKHSLLCVSVHITSGAKSKMKNQCLYKNCPKLMTAYNQAKQLAKSYLWSSYSALQAQFNHNLTLHLRGSCKPLLLRRVSNYSCLRLWVMPARSHTPQHSTQQYHFTAHYCRNCHFSALRTSTYCTLSERIHSNSSTALNVIKCSSLSI